MVKKLKIEFGISANVENENLSDTITFMHRANAFRRSRFTPNSNESGPYARIRNRTRTVFEFIEITDSIKGYKKGFNAAELTLKYKLSLFNRDLVLVNYTNYGSIREGASALPGVGNQNKIFLTTFYDEFTGFYAIKKKVVLIGFVAIESNQGNMRTTLSSETGKPLNQQGYGFGGGLDYDFMKNAGLYFRHRWMAHQDYNFVLDTFRGQETTVELKYFF